MRPAEAKGPRARLRRVLGRRGVAASEFALVVPIFVIALFATSDLIRVFRAQLRAETVAVQIGQLVSQCRRITDGGTIANAANPDNSDIAQIFAHGVRIAGNVINVSSATGGAMIITAVGRNGAANRAEWRRRVGNVTYRSRVSTGTPPVAATIAENFVVPVGQALFVTEVYAEVQPWALTAGLIGTALPKVVGGTTLFLTRAPRPADLLAAPTVSVNPDCTA
jgi:Flp pilus assembly protein TadG